MGLDMYAFSVRKEDALGDFECKTDNDGGEHKEIAYWRKFNALHGWMEKLYREKGGDKESFNCVPVRLTEDDLIRLDLDLIDGNLEPTAGFFFGEQEIEDYQLEAAHEFLAKARDEIDAGREVYYDSWW
jgi:hypothetical protein